MVAETGWLIDRQLGAIAEAAFHNSIAGGELGVEPLGAKDWSRVVELTRAYADTGRGSVDASLVAVAERLRITTIATPDERHFRVVRPAHVDAFTLVP